MSSSAYDFTFPVVAARVKAMGPSELVEFCGTAFSIGGDAFLTAGHVISCARDRQDGTRPGLGRYYPGRGLSSVWCEALEIYEPADLGLIRCPIDIAGGIALRWRPSTISDLNLLEDAWTAGYPFPINPATGYFYVRAFGGHVVGEGAFQDRVGNPGIYELSFHCPRGLSGAPLCVNRSQQIAGIIVGNRMTSMTVFREREVLDDGASVQELIRDEIMRIGIAIKARSVFEARFDSLGCTVGEWLTRHGLV